MTVSPDGEVLRAKFHEAVMRSAARLTYDTVGEILEHQNPTLMEQYQTLVPHLQQLHNLFKALKGAGSGAVASTSTPRKPLSSTARSARSSASCRASATMPTG
jgi:ribonuclease R